MHFSRNRRRSLLTAKNFTIAMVLVNAAGLALVQQKMRGAQVDDAIALDDGARPMTLISQVELPERQVLPEIKLAAAPSRPFVELPELTPLPELVLELGLADAADEFESAPLRAKAHKAEAGRTKGVKLSVTQPALDMIRVAEAEPELKLTRIDRMSAPIAARLGKSSAPQRPVPVDALSSIPAHTDAELTRSPSHQESFTAAFGRGAEAQAENEGTATFGAPNLGDGSSGRHPSEIDSFAPSVQDPVAGRPVGLPGSGTFTVPAPSADELPPLAPGAPTTETPPTVEAAA